MSLPEVSTLPRKRGRPRGPGKPKPLVDLDTLPRVAMLTAAQVRGIFGCAESTLKTWRKENRGPRFVVIEGRPRYLAGDLRDFMQAHEPQGIMA